MPNFSSFGHIQGTTMAARTMMYPSVTHFYKGSNISYQTQKTGSRNIAMIKNYDCLGSLKKDQVDNQHW